MSALKAVLWDMDGTLIDSEPLWVAEENRLMRDAGLEWTDADAEQFVGQPLPVTAQALRTRGLQMPLDEVLDELINGTTESLRRRLPWHSGARELLESLRAASLSTALVTMSHRTAANPLLDDADGLFDTAVTGDIVTRGKPDPDPYLMAMERLGVEPSECIAFEDSLPGVTSALAAGVTTVAVQRHIPLGEAGAHYLISTLEGLDVETLRGMHASARR